MIILIADLTFITCFALGFVILGGILVLLSMAVITRDTRKKDKR